jgi:hypothetical protein
VQHQDLYTSHRWMPVHPRGDLVRRHTWNRSGIGSSALSEIHRAHHRGRPLAGGGELDRGVGVGGLLHGLHDVDDVQRDLVVRPVRPALGDGEREVGQPVTAAAKLFGSGTESEPPVPCTSMRGSRAAQMSKLITSVDSAPDVCSRIPVIVESTATSKEVPARGPWPMVRVADGRADAPTTRATGPSRCTSDVR